MEEIIQGFAYDEFVAAIDQEMMGWKRINFKGELFYMNKEKAEMKPFSEMSFEEILEQNEKRIHYHIHRMGIRDTYREFYSEGLYAMWTAYKKYEPNKGPLATYFNYMIRNRLIDMLRKENREQEKDEILVEKGKESLGSVHATELGTLGSDPHCFRVLKRNNYNFT